MLTAPPVASADYFEVLQNGELAIEVASLVANDSDADGDALSIALVAGEGPRHGKLTLEGSGTLIYQPRPGYYSITAPWDTDDSFRYYAWNGSEFSNEPVTVKIRVVPIVPDSTQIICSCSSVTVHGITIHDDVWQDMPPTVVFPGPIARPDSHSTAEDTPLTIVEGGVLHNDTSGDGSPLVAGTESQPLHGTVTVNSDGSFAYVPSRDFFGQDQFTYRVTNGSPFWAIGTVSLTISPVNDAPLLNDDSFTSETGLPLGLRVADLLANDRDVENETLKAVIRTTDVPEHGALTLSGADVIYTPDIGYQGLDRFAYLATDGSDFSEQAATVSLTLTAPVRHNRLLAADVNSDLQVTARDVLLVINYLNAFGPGSVERAATVGRDLLDVNGSGIVTATDALMVINQLNAGLVSGQQELASSAAQNEALPIDQASITEVELSSLEGLLASQGRRRGRG